MRTAYKASILTTSLLLFLVSCGQSETEKAAQRQNDGAKARERELHSIKPEGNNRKY